jgi:hypothetical protein
MLTRVTCWLTLAALAASLSCGEARTRGTSEQGETPVRRLDLPESSTHSDELDPRVEADRMVSADAAPSLDFRVYTGVYDDHETLEHARTELSSRGYDATAVVAAEGLLLAVGGGHDFEAANALCRALRDAGYPSFITASQPRDGFSARTGPTLDDTSEVAVGPEDAEGPSGPFCDRRPWLPPLDEGQIVEHIRLPEDTQARDPQLWIDELTDAGHELMTAAEAREMLQINETKRQPLLNQLRTLKQRIAAHHCTVYVGSYARTDDAECVAGCVARLGLKAEIQPGAQGSWIVVLPKAESEVAATGLEQRLNAAGITNYARLEPSNAMLAERRQLNDRLNELAEQDRFPAALLAVYEYIVQ